MVNVIVDIIIAIILVIGLIWGLKIGFVKAVAKPTKVIMAIFLAISLASVIGNGIIRPIIDEPIITKLTEFVTERIGDGVTATEELPTLIKAAAALAGVDLAELASSEAQADLVGEIIAAITDPILNMVSGIIGFFIAYIICKLLLSLMFGIVNAIIDNGVIGIVNRVLGCVVTTFIAATIVWVLCSVSDLIFNLPGIYEQGWVEEFDGGWLYSFFRNMSPIDMLLGLLLSF
ncbi:MAG: hypothetical protein IKC32_07250 [Clostridia bacterium]|nr:hypothetical protein [Clostridia bacterium]